MQLQQRNSLPVRTAEMLGVALVYFLAAKLCQSVAIEPGNVTPVWIPSGVILAAVLLRGYWIWPGIWLGAFAGNVWAYFDASLPSNAMACLFAGTANGIGDVLGAVGGAYLIHRSTGTNNPFGSAVDVTKFIAFGVLAGPLVSAIFGVTSLYIGGFVSWDAYAYTWATWWTGDAVGALTITPAIVVLATRKATGTQTVRLFEGIGFAVVLLTTTVYCMDFLHVTPSVHFTLVANVPILMWAVFRLGQRVTFPALAVIVALAVLATARGHGPFVGNGLNLSLIDLQLFVAVITTTMLLLSAATEDRKGAEIRLKRVAGELETRVEDLVTVNDLLQHEMRERKRAETEAARNERLASLGTLAAGIAHEINNPLQNITMSAELAIQTKDLPPDQRPPSCRPLAEVLRQIQQQAFRCGRIVKSVLQFAREETSEKWPCSLAKVVNHVQDQLRETASKEDVSVKVELPGELPDITMNPTEIEQVLDNLVSNAIRASQSGDNVTIRVEPESDTVRLLVEDQGCGMTREQTGKALDPFFTTHQKRGDTGLGLSIVHGIVKAHGGAVGIESTANKGTTVTLVLPLNPPVVQEPPAVRKFSVAEGVGRGEDLDR